MKAKSIILCLAFVGTISSCVSKSTLPVYLDENSPLEDRVEDALGRMTLLEKVTILHAQSKFSSAGVPRLGIPELWCDDGPHGVRPDVLWDEWNQAGQTNDSCVAFPALTCLAASWDESLAELYGRSIGEEARYRGKDVLLAPGVNILRTPLGGRNFEYMGEDPFLASRICVPYIRGVQSNGVACCVKHFALNNQESMRNHYDAVVDDRTLYEIYLPAFKAAVTEGQVWSIMGAYNNYKGRHLCENPWLLNDVLKGEWDFDGAVISDWGGTHDTDLAVSGGLDLEFGTGTDGLTTRGNKSYDNYYLALPYYEKLVSGTASLDTLDDKVRRVLRLIMRTAMNKQKPYGSLCSPEHYSAARKIAGGGIVLLKNENAVLPLTTPAVRKIAVVGENAVKMMTVGGGSSSLKVQKEVSPLEGIRVAAALVGCEVVYERGYIGDLGTTYDNVSSGQDLSDPRSRNQLIADAVKVASEADVTVFVGGLNKSFHQDCEGADRLDMGLPYAQNELIDALCEACPKVCVVLVSGNPVEMPWVDKVQGLLQAWYLGSEAGNAIADILFGKVCPSGKLPFTFPVSLEDSPAHMLDAYDSSALSIDYKEGILVGYRWFDTKNIDPLFEFGYGLSYTDFEFGQAKARRVRDGVKLSVPVTNVGAVAGAEVVQVYVRDPECSVERPDRELKGFRKVFLEPGEKTLVVITLPEDSFKYFDADAHRWVLEKGKFELLVGASSRDIRSTVTITY